LRVLLTSNAAYLPPRGGSTRSNLAYLRILAGRGHECRVVAGAPEAITAGQRERLREELREQQLDAAFADRFSNDGSVRGALDGISIIVVRDLARHTNLLGEEIRDFQPDWVLVSSEDLSHRLLLEAERAAPGRLVYLAHTPQWFPFGPASWNPEEGAAAIVRDSAAVVVIGKAMAAYVERHLGRTARVAHPPVYGESPWPSLADFETGCIGMVNPCAVKGISLFLAMADRMPDTSFVALPGWGTTQDDLRALRSRPNVSLFPRVKNIEQFLRRLKVLVMPSLWLEGFGLITMEAMLRGVPVIASDSGGLREAKAGTNYVIPVQPIERYERVYDDRNMPRPFLARQNAGQWVAAIRTLTASRQAFQLAARNQQQAAMQFVQQIDPLALEKILTDLPQPAGPVAGSQIVSAPEMSDARRALLLKRLRERAKE